MSRTKNASHGKRQQRARERYGDDYRGSKKAKQESPEQRPKSQDFDATTASMNPQLLADMFVQVMQRHFKDSTAVELEDKYLPSKAFLDTSAFERTHTLENLPEYLETFVGGKENLTKPIEVSGPHTIFICSSGIRAADVTRALRPFRMDDSAIAKLFAKHLKLKDTIEYVKKTKFGFGVGTPARLNDLMAAEALNLDALERIVIDGSYLDEKRRTVFTMKDLFVPTLELLNKTEIKARLGEARGIRILVF